jgi:hypothetical protein
MLGAFDAVCAQLRLPTHEGSRSRKRVASIIFDLAMAGEIDEKRLAAKVLAEFRLEERHASVHGSELHVPVGNKGEKYSPSGSQDPFPACARL